MNFVTKMFVQIQIFFTLKYSINSLGENVIVVYKIHKIAIIYVVGFTNKNEYGYLLNSFFTYIKYIKII